MNCLNVLGLVIVSYAEYILLCLFLKKIKFTIYVFKQLLFHCLQCFNLVYISQVLTFFFFLAKINLFVICSYFNINMSQVKIWQCWRNECFLSLSLSLTHLLAFILTESSACCEPLDIPFAIIGYLILKCHGTSKQCIVNYRQNAQKNLCDSYGRQTTKLQSLQN